MFKIIRSPLFSFMLVVILIGAVTLLGPQEKSLGSNVRIIYLHGAWVLTAEVAFLAAAVLGVAALVTRKSILHTWSRALGWSGTFFWITYLPLSLWAMETNWNGLFLAEPRFRMALIFAVTGVLLQIGLWLFNLPWLTSLANIVFFIVLRVVFSTASNIMHPPPSPIFSSGNTSIITFFIGLNLLTWLAAFLLTRFWLVLVGRKARMG